MRDPDIDRFVKLEVQRRYAVIDRHCLEVELLDFTVNSQRAGTFGGSAALEGEAKIREEAIRQKIHFRIEAETAVHRRKGIQISADEQELIFTELSDLIEAEVSQFFGARYALAVRMGSNGNFADGLRSRSRDRLLAEAKRAVELAVLDVKLPSASDAPASVTINVNAPNFGIVAGRIERLQIEEPSHELKTLFMKLLEASKVLPDESGAEVRGIVDGLAAEAERGPHHNPGLIRASVRRLGDLLSRGAQVAAVLTLM
jgi:hypothetical protein